MKTALLVGVCLFFSVAIFWTVGSVWGSAESALDRPRAKIVAAPPVIATPMIVAPTVVDAGAPQPSEITSKLGAYLADAAMSWMRTDAPAFNYPKVTDRIRQAFIDQEDETPEAVDDRVAEVGLQVAEYVSGDVACLWPEKKTDAVFCAETGLVLMSLAFNETRFRGYIDDGRCNDLSWRKTAQASKLLKLGTCDYENGHVLACSLWQLHDFDSSSRPEAIKEALERVRRSLKLTGNLAGYTGEPDPGNAPKARIRLTMAQEAPRQHPFAP